MNDSYQEIYALQDPRTLVVRYVGISGNALRRYKQHIAASHSLQVQAWVASLERLQMAPGVVLVDEAFSPQEGADKEAFWIQWFSKHGAPLLNQQQPYISPAKTIKIFEKMASSRWRDLDRSMGEIVQNIIAGRYENISYKDLASIEWRLFHMGDYVEMLLFPRSSKVPFEQALMESTREGERRFGVPVHKE